MFWRRRKSAFEPCDQSGLNCNVMSGLCNVKLHVVFLATPPPLDRMLVHKRVSPLFQLNGGSEKRSADTRSCPTLGGLKLSHSVVCTLYSTMSLEGLF